MKEKSQKDLFDFVFKMKTWETRILVFYSLMDGTVLS